MSRFEQISTILKDIYSNPIISRIQLHFKSNRKGFSFCIHLFFSLISGEITFNILVLLFLLYYRVNMMEEIVQDILSIELLSVLRISLIVFYFFVVWYNFLVHNRESIQIYSIKECKFLSKIMNEFSNETKREDIIESYQLDKGYTFLFNNSKKNDITIEKRAIWIFGLIPFITLAVSTLLINLLEVSNLAYPITFIDIPSVFYLLLIILTACTYLVIGFIILRRSIFTPNMNQRKWKKFWSNLTILTLELVTNEVISAPEVIKFRKYSKKRIEKILAEKDLKFPLFEITNESNKEIVRRLEIYREIKKMISDSKLLISRNNLNVPNIIKSFIEKYEEPIAYSSVREVLNDYNLSVKYHRILNIFINFPELHNNFEFLINLDQDTKERLKPDINQIYSEVDKEPSWIFPNSLKSLWTILPIIMTFGGFISYYFAEYILQVPLILIELFYLL